MVLLSLLPLLWPTGDTQPLQHTLVRHRTNKRNYLARITRAAHPRIACRIITFDHSKFNIQHFRPSVRSLAHHENLYLSKCKLHSTNIPNFSFVRLYKRRSQSDSCTRHPKTKRKRQRCASHCMNQTSIHCNHRPEILPIHLPCRELQDISPLPRTKTTLPKVGTRVPSSLLRPHGARHPPITVRTQNRLRQSPSRIVMPVQGSSLQKATMCTAS